jgi:hypothetical protein
VAFQVNDVSSQLFRDRQLAGYLAGKARLPERIERLRRCLLAHDLDHLRARDEPGTWKSLQNCTGAKEVITVAMGGIYRREILAPRRHPIRQRSSLLDRNRGVDQDSVPLPRNEG